MSSVESTIESLQRSLDSGRPIDTFLLNTVLQSDHFSLSSLHSLISLINTILYSPKYPSLDPTADLLEFLPKVLAKIPFNDIFGIYPEQFIIENLSQISEENLQINLIILKILQSKISEPDCVHFLDRTSLVASLVNQYSTVEELPLSAVNQIESLVRYSLSQDSSNHPPFNSGSQIQSTTLKSRLLSYFLILAEFNILVPPQYFTYTRDEILLYNEEDPLFAILLIQFYGDLFTLSDVTPESTAILKELNTLLQQNVDFLSVEVANVFIKLSYEQKYLQILSEIVTKIEDLLDTDVIARLLSQLNPQLIYNIEVPLDEYNLLSNKHFSALLNIISNPALFQKYGPEYLTTSKLTNLTLDKLYAILLVVSKHSHTQDYLFSSLPQVMNNLINEEAVANPELFKLKLDIVRNLLVSDADSLQPWEQGLNSSLSKLQNGDGIPRVAVINRAG